MGWMIHAICSTGRQSVSDGDSAVSIGSFVSRVKKKSVAIYSMLRDDVPTLIVIIVIGYVAWKINLHRHQFNMGSLFRLNFDRFNGGLKGVKTSMFVVHNWFRTRKERCNAAFLN